MKIDEALLRRLAGEKFFLRGLDYARRGVAHIEGRLSDGVIASVDGSETYTVRLQWHDSELRGECDCPIGDEFCKHKVAVALLWAGIVADADEDPAAGETPPSRKKSGKRKTDGDDEILSAWLAERPPAELRELILRLAERDKDVWKQLVTRARIAHDNPDQWKAAIGKLIGRRRFRDYRENIAYARRLDTLVDLLEDLRRRAPTEALGLADHILHRLFGIYAESDDSSGALGEILTRIGAAYQLAAQAAHPDREAFAKSYFKLRDADDWNLVGAVGDHVDALGSKGLATLEKLAHAAFAALPPRAVSATHSWDENEGRRRQLQRLLEEIAGYGGDLDALLTLKARSAHTAWDYLELARLCAEHRRDRQATEWLERGLKAHRDDTRLLEVLAEKYTLEGFPEDALKLYWRLYKVSPSARHFLILRGHTQSDGEWPQWRQRAYDFIEKKYGRPHAAANLVELHLADDDAATAWTLAAESGVPLHLWAQLGVALESTQPEQALQAYRTVAKSRIEHGGNRAYAEAIDWLRRMHPLHQRLGSAPVFADYIAQLREAYRAKRNFMAMLGEFARSLGV
ncbi:MAG: SWIM zinc finger family protein [Rudaea sp.]